MRIDRMETDHGGDIDLAVGIHGGTRDAWIDLSTGINRRPYPVRRLPVGAWHDLPDTGATAALARAARGFWRVPDAAAVLAAPGASSLIARIPALTAVGRVAIPAPTYNEHARAFLAAGWALADGASDAQVIVHPNNPDGRIWRVEDCTADLMVIDESFCDVAPDQSLIALSARPGTVLLKSLGKFWGLAGVRLGFAIGDPDLIARLSSMLGPWPVSGPALAMGTAALSDTAWADRTRQRLGRDASRLDRAMTGAGATLIGGTSLFRLYDVGDASLWQTHLATRQIWSRTFPYSDRWIRLGLPGPQPEWDRLLAALTPGPAR